MKKRFPLIAVAAALLLGAFLLIMTGLHSPTEVLGPPNPVGEYRELQQAFENAAGGATEYKLQYPEEGDYRSAYVLYDLDGDDEEEALVFYTKTDSESVVRMSLLDLRDDEWVSVLSETGYGNKVDSVAFSDLDGDGTSEVILSWSLAGADSARTMTVHTVSLPENKSASFKTIANMPYRAMHVSDFDNDGNDEILVLWSETESKVQHNYAALMKRTSSGLSFYGEPAELDSDASVYDNIVRQDGRTPLVFVDARKGDGTMFTEVLWWDGVNKKMKAPFTANSTRTNLSTLRASDLLTSDIDEDGIYEIPIAYSDIQGRTADGETYIPLTVWSVTGTADPGALQSKAYSIVDTTNHFILYLASGYRNSLVTYRNDKTGVLTAYFLNEDGSRGEPLFSLVYQDDSAKKKPDKYTFLAEDAGRTVYGTLTSAGKELGLTDKVIEEQIVFY